MLTRISGVSIDLLPPFFQTLVIDSENKKAALLVTGERLIIGSWKPAPFLKMKKAGILMASRHKNPGRFKNDNFLKTLYKISALFQISSENKKGAAQSLSACGWYSPKDASQRVCIYRTVKNRVHILPLISELISVYFSWIYSKNTLDATYFKLHLKCWINMDVPSTFDLVNLGLSLFKNPRKLSRFRSQVSTPASIATS